jgi:diguanylate cyclase (GGDEF)-like protein
MVDLDDFKEVNDRYGHGTGDQVLLEVTKRINSVIRSSDVLVRWGGDEFLIVSRYSNRAEAAAFASRILFVVGHRGPGVANADIDFRQTCSIGWAAFPWDPGEPDAVPLEAVLGLADRGVFEAKASGKNRAIGVLPSDTGTKILFATAGDRVSTYCVETVSVEGPAQSIQPATSDRLAAISN